MIGDKMKKNSDSKRMPIAAVVALIVLSILVPVGAVCGVFAGMHIEAKLDSKDSGDELVHVEYGYSDKKEEWHPGFGSGLGYCEYHYDGDEYTQQYKRNGYYSDVTKDDIEEICKYVNHFNTTCSELGSNLIEDMVDEGDRFDIVYPDEYYKYDHYYVYYYDRQSRTLFELWWDD